MGTIDFVNKHKHMEKQFNCPICSQPMKVITTDRGVMLRCDALTGCLPHESVFGFGSSEKAAHEIACQKYRKS